MRNRITESELKSASLINKERIAEDIGNTLVLAPHPDDESLGCGGLITMLTHSGKEVTLVFITNGSASHLHSNEYNADKLGALRQKEATEASITLGVKKKNIHFLNAPDGGLTDLSLSEINHLVAQIQTITEAKNYRTIVFPWRRDPHPDHRVTSNIARLFIDSLKEYIIALEYPIWLWKNGELEDWPLRDEVHLVRLNIEELAETKQKAIQKHQSQLGKVIKDDPSGFVLTEELLKPFQGDYEYFFTDVDRSLNSLDEAYFDQIYRNSKDPWNFKKSQYEKEKYEESVTALGDKIFKNGLEIGCSIGIQTRMLANLCEDLLAIDISPIAIEEAKENCSDKDNIEFQVMNVENEFPQSSFDLITLCEVGYYLQKDSLLDVFEHIDKALVDGGSLLVVHWIGFVPEYPLSGDEVHQSLENFLSDKQIYKRVKNQRSERYRLEVWEKLKA